MKIIILEDDSASLAMLIKMLQMKGHDCKGFGLPKLAFESIKNCKYDLLILDFMLPDTDGLQFLKLLEDNHLSLPTIITTASDSKTLVKQFFEFNAVVDYALKPVGVDFACRICNYQHKAEKQRLIEEIETLKLKVIND